MRRRLRIGGDFPNQHARARQYLVDGRCPHVAPIGVTGQFDQLEKAYPEPETLPAVSVTDVPDASTALHFAPQLIASKALVTKPVPILATVNVTAGTKFAVTVLAAVTLNEQTLLFGKGQFAQPENKLPADGVAVRAMFALAATLAVQTVPQFTVELVPVTVPPPEPARTTVTKNVPEPGEGETYRASTPRPAPSFTATVHVRDTLLVLSHPPYQPLKVPPVGSTTGAVRVTDFPNTNHRTTF